MKARTFLSGLVMCQLLFVVNISAASAARISSVNGKASILRKGSEKWRPARLNLPLNVGDQLFCRKESFVEIRYSMGTVVRMNEDSKITIEASSQKGVKTKNSLGSVWINMKKITKQGKNFQMSSPTAVAAIRGTVFQMTTQSDSTTDVNVFDGKVDVGLTSDVKNKIKKKPKKAMTEPVEVPGPEEIPGPFEVPLEQWRTIIAGQQISVRKDGTYAQSDFDVKNAQQDNFVKLNLELDKKLMQEK